MSTDEAVMAGEGVLQLAARTIPVPTTVSRRAQAALALGRAPAAESPALDDVEGWRKRNAATDEMILTMLTPRVVGIEAKVDEREVEGVGVFVITPPDGQPDVDGRVYLDIHGGALVVGGGRCCRAMGLMAFRRAGVRTWSVDYRMPPEHPYPAPLDDCLTVYRELLKDHRPSEVIVGGGSAGGNLAAALILRARDEGLPLPAAAVLISPEVDLTESGDTFRTNLGVDTVLSGSLMPSNLLYAAGHDLAHPYLSPLFGDFTKGFPPTFIQAGTRDLFLSNAVRMHRVLRAAGVAAELHVFEAMPHGGFGGAPEDAEIDAEARRFIDSHWQ